jgi:uncharacterized protein
MNKTLIEFPCNFTIKIIGLNLPNFVEEVCSTIAKHCDSFNPNVDIKAKISNKNNYLSLSAIVYAKSQHHLDQIYTALNAHHLVKITL